MFDLFRHRKKSTSHRNRQHHKFRGISRNFSERQPSDEKNDLYEINSYRSESVAIRAPCSTTIDMLNMYTHAHASANSCYQQPQLGAFDISNTYKRANLDIRGSDYFNKRSEIAKQFERERSRSFAFELNDFDYDRKPFHVPSRSTHY